MNIAIIITYKRQILLENLLSSIQSQDQKFDFVYIVDNESSIDTKLIVQKYDDTFIYLCPNLNLGCSGGFKFGLNEILKIHKNGNVIFLDDDIKLYNNFLKVIANSNELKSGNCVLPSKIYTDGSEFIWTPILTKNKLFVKRNLFLNNDNSVNQKIENITFEACVLPISVINEIGFPNDKFFIDGDDFEYGIRISKVCNIYKLNEILVERQIKIPENIKSINLFFYKFISTRININQSRLYYEIRNKYLIGKTLKYNKVYIFLQIQPYYLKLLIGQILFKELSIFNAVKLITLANTHGIKDMFGEKNIFK